MRRGQADAEAGSSARQLSVDDPADLSLSSSGTSGWWTRPALPRWPVDPASGATTGRCWARTLFVALAVLASFAVLAAWPIFRRFCEEAGIAEAVGRAQLDSIEASGVCSIVLGGTTAADGTDMSGWELGAQRWIPGDKRDDVSTYASVQNLSAWERAGVWWEVAPHVHEPGAYRIRIRQVEENGWRKEIGWYLSASRFYATDERGLFSSYVAILSEPTMIPVDDSEVGERIKLRVDNTSSLLSEPRMIPVNDTMLPAPGAYVASSAWMLVPLSEAGAYRIQLKTGPPGVEEMAGWYLSAERFFDRDRRNDDSTYVSLVRDEGEATTWILQCSSCCVGMDAGTNGEEFPDFYK